MLAPWVYVIKVKGRFFWVNNDAKY
jgi:hypothetical protein